MTPSQPVRFRRKFRNAIGLTLIEVMVALVLGLFISGAVLSVFISNRQIYRQVENLSQLQDNTRILFEWMARDIRDAGFIACGTNHPVVNVVNSTAWWNDFQQAIQGYDGSDAMPARAFGSGAGDRVAGTDAVLIWTTSTDNPAWIVQHDAPAAQLKVNTLNHGFMIGDILMACDHRLAAIFQVSNLNASNVTIVHNTGASITPGNCRKELGLQSVAPHDCSPPTDGALYSFESDGQLTRVHAFAWYVGHNARGGRSLFRISLGVTAAGALATTPEEMIEGVSDLQIEYLEASAVTPATAYIQASSVGDWGNVTAVRISPSYTTLDNVGTDGAVITRVYPIVVSLRSRLP